MYPDVLAGNFACKKEEEDERGEGGFLLVRGTQLIGSLDKSSI